MICLIEQSATQKQIDVMLKEYGQYIKLAVDVKKGILAGGSELHADCEAILLERGSLQEDIWGADWLPKSKEVRFGSLINIRPKQNNPSMEIQDKKLRSKIETIVRTLLEKT